ncbi:hypothetical protein ABZ953_32975 [Streptomyces sp. NPDC046465]|uniref:hypothetical protein n=1 Tax=Streptomyces sp. NPDC046465 TaxID=3155810 RepID=UPI0033C697DC
MSERVWPIVLSEKQGVLLPLAEWRAILAHELTLKAVVNAVASSIAEALEVKDAYRSFAEIKGFLPGIESPAD